jgi:aminopeptidase YwaD
LILFSDIGLLNFAFGWRLKNDPVVHRYSILFLIVAGCGTQRPTTTQAEPLLNNLRTHVEFLASDRLEGRRTGTEGEKLAAEYISNAFYSLFR